MTGVETVIALAALAGAGASIAQATSGPDTPDMPKPADVPVPEGPATQPDQTSFEHPSSAPTPPIQFGSSFGGLTPLQQRTFVATRGVSGDDSTYRSPEAKDYFKQRALFDYTNPSGGVMPDLAPTDIEKQYVSQVFGEQPRENSTASFLSAILRGTAT